MEKIRIRKPTSEELDALDISGWGIWTCEPSTFDWTYAEQETCFVLEGKVTVKTAVEEVSFGKGDLVTFPKGLSCRWTVYEAVRKHYRFE